MIDADELLTVGQVAQRLHVCPRTVQVWAQSGRIPTIRITPKVIRFAWPEVLAALKQGPEKGANHGD
jgi:excisionase family DNA binding protein